MKNKTFFGQTSKVVICFLCFVGVQSFQCRDLFQQSWVPTVYFLCDSELLKILKAKSQCFISLVPGARLTEAVTQAESNHQSLQEKAEDRKVVVDHKQWWFSGLVVWYLFGLDLNIGGERCVLVSMVLSPHASMCCRFVKFPVLSH